MGNCQAADTAATVVILQHPDDGRAEPDRRYSYSCRSPHLISATQVMATNPGHYVAVIIIMKSKSTTTTTAASKKKKKISLTPPVVVRYVKLLRPDDVLLPGNVYRLVTFEEVLRVFGSKKRVRLSRLIAARQINQSEKEAARERLQIGEDVISSNSEDSASATVVEGEEEEEGEAHVIIEDSIGTNNGMMMMMMKRRSQWRPSLQSIAEVGNC